MADIGHPEKVIVVGASGFLGARVAQDLHQMGYLVTGVHRSSHIAGVTWRQLRVNEYEARAIDLSADILVNCAGPSSDWLRENPNHAADLVDSHGERLIEIFEQTGADRLINFSTIHVIPFLGMPVNLEEVGSIGVTTLYPRVHLALEEKLLDSSPACSLRLSNSFGRTPSQRKSHWKHFTHDIVRKLVTTGIAEINGNSGITRDFVPLEKVTHAVSQAIRSRAHGIKNLTSERSVSLRTWAENIRQVGERLLGERLEIRELAEHIEDHHQGYVSDFAMGADLDAAFKRELRELFKMAQERKAAGQL